jgi:hypothetical protein
LALGRKVDVWSTERGAYYQPEEGFIVGMLWSEIEDEEGAAK